MDMNEMNDRWERRGHWMDGCHQVPQVAGRVSMIMDYLDDYLVEVLGGLESEVNTLNKRLDSLETLLLDEAEAEDDKARQDCHPFGACPTCGEDGTILNYSREHWAVCHEHKKRWYIGSNLFSTWHHEDEGVWRANAYVLSQCEDVTEVAIGKGHAPAEDELAKFRQQMKGIAARGGGTYVLTSDGRQTPLDETKLEAEFLDELRK